MTSPINNAKPQRLGCPGCGHSGMIMHKKTLLVSMTYICPDCGAKIETTPPKVPPPQPTLPPGMVFTHGVNQIIQAITKKVA